MSERPLDADSFQYERPNRKWVCGKAAGGQACHLGPDSRGHCRVTYECRPALETKPGESKGRYRCSRPAEYGGPCPGGPLPDGTCCRPLAKCVPVRSLRAKRFAFSFGAVIVAAGLLLAALGGPARWGFISPGALSRAHATPTFARLAREQEHDNCAVCHNAARGSLRGWLQASAATRPAPWQMQAMAAEGPLGLSSIDRNCLVCHQGHSFHQPNVVDARSCSVCHTEHQGPGPMRAPADAGCISCHGDAAAMRASIARAAALPASAFDYRPDLGRAVFHAPRPRDGFTRVFHGFAEDHPEFQIIADKLKDPDTLRFNHELHLGSHNVSALKGRPLACADCHQMDSAGVHFLRITYQQNCRQCHSLQFDPRNPGLLVPHGDTEHVRAFLRSLPQQYLEYALTLPRTGGETSVLDFASRQMELLRRDYVSGEALESRVFGGPDVLGSSVFPSCAYCHEVKTSAKGAPTVTPPVIPDRWMIRGQFDHSKHLISANRPGGKIVCSECHQAEHSRLTSDVLLPSRRTCAECHSPKGGVADSCSTCHSYHSLRKDAVAER